MRRNLQRKEGEEIQKLPDDKRAGPPLLLQLNRKLISLLQSIRSRRGVVSFSAVKATAFACANSNRTPTVPWLKSIYWGCNFSRRAGTTTRPPVPQALFKECKLTLLTDIIRTIKRHNIPSELELNADKNPCSYVSVGGMTMAQYTKFLCSSISFVISLAGNFFCKCRLYIREKPQPTSQGASSFPNDLQSHMYRIQSITQMKGKR